MITAHIWNKQHPIGTPVRYFPVKGGKAFWRTYTASEAKQLQTGIIVVQLKSDGKAWRNVDNIEVVK